MSNIALYFVEGLSRLDTPVFDSEENQETFFAEQERYVVPNDSFYVPKFKNEIILSTDDADLDGTFNYLSLEFKNKKYYYFIDKVEYVSEDTIRLYITLDVIQTYMFNVNFISSEIERKSIKRWTPTSYINRDYIRENYSNGTFVNQTFTQSTNKYPFLIGLVKLVDDITYRYNYSGHLDAGYPLDSIVQGKHNGRTIISPYYYCLMIIPIDPNYSITFDSRYTIPPDETLYGYTMGGLDYSVTFTQLRQMPFVQEITILPSEYIEKFGWERTAQTSTSATFTRVAGRESDTCVSFLQRKNTGGTWDNICKCIFIQHSVDLLTKVTQRTTPFIKNTAQDRPFNYIYCPQLLDENYVRVLWGERATLCSYPLHVLGQTSFYTALIHDFDNSRQYFITLNNSANIEYDVYRTSVYSKSIEALPVFNDAYNEYVSRNYGSLTRGIALAKEQNLFNTITGTLKDQSSRAVKFSKADPGSNAVNSGMQIGDAVMNLGLDIADYFQKNYSIDEKLAIQYENLEHTPDTVKQGNDGVFDFLTKIIAPVYIYQECTNINECAEIFESYGYSVHEIVTDNLFTINNRFYYDVVKCADVNITLVDVPSDEESITAIKNRFRSGLRLWHTDEGVLNTDSVEGVTLSMGQVCVYDNVEV